MPISVEKFKPQELQSELLERPGTPEKPKPTEADLENITTQAEGVVANEETRVLQTADKRLEKALASVGLEQQKAQSIFTVGGFADRIKNAKEKISTLAKSTKAKLQELISAQPNVIHFKDMAPTPATTEKESTTGKEQIPQPEAPQVQNTEITPETSQETQEQRELQEYLTKEVFVKFGLTKEDEQRALAEVPEDEREILQRSFENSRLSLEAFYNSQTIDGIIDGHAVNKAEKQLTYKTLAPILENKVAEIKPKLAELGIEISLQSLGFSPDTASRDALYYPLEEINHQIKYIIRERVEQNIIQALLQKGDYKGIGIPTEEQQRDAKFMEQRGKQLNILQQQAINEATDAVGFSKWMTETEAELNEPYTFRPGQHTSEIPSVNATEHLVRRTKEQVTQSLEEEKIRAEQTGFLCVNIDANKLQNVLEQGGFRDIFSLSEEELKEMKRAVGRGDDFYMNQRTTIEQALGVYNPDKPTIYGTYSSENGEDEKNGGADTYGSIFLKLKPSVKATFCEGDSMSGGNTTAYEKLVKMGLYTSTDWGKAAQYRQIAHNHVGLIKGLSNVHKKIENEMGRGVNSFGYIEAHIKGLQLDDIESINIPKSVMDSHFYHIDKGDPRIIISRLQQNLKWKDRINIIENA